MFDLLSWAFVFCNWESYIVINYQTQENIDQRERQIYYKSKSYTLKKPKFGIRMLQLYRSPEKVQKE